MARYFFHLHDGGGSYVPDEEGLELGDMQLVRQTALKGARSIVSHDAQSGFLDLSGRIEVADAQGRTVLVIAFKDAIELRSKESAPSWPRSLNSIPATCT